MIGTQHMMQEVSNFMLPRRRRQGRMKNNAIVNTNIGASNFTSKGLAPRDPSVNKRTGFTLSRKARCEPGKSGFPRGRRGNSCLLYTSPSPRDRG
eukprot:6491254-Amphidinium_carterae.3